jgi:hypothetical protein
MEELLYELAYQLFKVDNSEHTVELLKKVKKLDKSKFQEAISGMDVEDLVGKKPKKKRLNSGVKGKSGERSLVKLFNERFTELLSKNKSWGEFHRVVGSGNLWSQANLSQRSEEMHSGDVVCENLKFVIESKNGYDDIDLISLLEEGNKDIDSFLQQVTNDSVRSGKKPLLIWKKARRPRLAFIKDLGEHADKFKGAMMQYKEWTIICLEDLLKLPDEFFF